MMAFLSNAAGYACYIQTVITRTRHSPFNFVVKEKAGKEGEANQVEYGVPHNKIGSDLTIKDQHT